ncbi:MAG: FAD-binding protein [Deltaproteobacteria bacterium]|nr:FAD-binding protein [Deltaproteobacteria bacterium]
MNSRVAMSCQRHRAHSGLELARAIETRREEAATSQTSPVAAPGDGYVRLSGRAVYPAVSRGKHLAELRTQIGARRAAQVDSRQASGSSGSRSVVVVGAGPAGLVSAIHAYKLGFQVTLVEPRGQSQAPPQTLNLRTEVRAALAQIDPDLFREVWRVATRIRWAEVLKDGDETLVAKSNPLEILFHQHGVPEDSLPMLRRRRPESKEEIEAKRDKLKHQAGNGFSAPTAPPLSEDTEYAPARHAASQSTWQVSASDLIRVLWNFVETLQSNEKEGRERLRILRGWEVTELPVAEEGEVRRRVIVERSTTGRDATVSEPERQDLGVPDDIILADGANSKLVSKVGTGFADVGPNTRFVAGLIDRLALMSAGEGKGVVRRATEDYESLILRHIVMSQASRDSSKVWALVEVPSDLDFTDEQSVRRFFGESLSEEEATRQYFALKTLPLINRGRSDGGFEPGDLLNEDLPYGPRMFVMQSRIAGQPDFDAQNVHCVGDAKGFSHFLASLGASTGLGPDQLALGLYWGACGRKRAGRDTVLESMTLDRRLFNNVWHWQNVGLGEFSSVTAANLGSDVSRRAARATNQPKTVKANATTSAYQSEADPSASGNVVHVERPPRREPRPKRSAPQRVLTAPAEARLASIDALVDSPPNGPEWSLIPQARIGGGYGSGTITRYLLRDVFFDRTEMRWTIQRLDTTRTPNVEVPEPIVTEFYEKVLLQPNPGYPGLVELNKDDARFHLGDAEAPEAERRKEIARRMALPMVDASQPVRLCTIGPLSSKEWARTVTMSDVLDIGLEGSTWVVELRSGETVHCQALKLSAGDQSAYLAKDARSFSRSRNA